MIRRFGYARFSVVKRVIVVGIACMACMLAMPAATQAQPTSHPLLQEWTWANDDFVSAPWPNTTVPSFGNGAWVADVTYAEGSVATTDQYVREPGSQSIRCFLEAKAPLPAGADQAGHYRAEIRRYHWHEPVPMKTEEWHGFSYFFPPDYVHDHGSRGVFVQLHAGRRGPPISLDHYVPADHSGAHGGKLFVNRRWGAYSDSSKQHRQALPLEFEPGKWYDIVIHVIWDTEAGGDGLTEVWINGQKYYSETGGNTYDAGSDPGDPNLPYGGTLKLGLYKWPWRTQAGIDASENAGVEKLEMFIGPVRTIRLPQGQWDDEGYHYVAPRGPRPVIE